jgi:hypothetical protein
MKDSDRNKTISSSNIKEEIYATIYNTFYSKLACGENILNSFIKSFDYLAVNMDCRFKTLSELVKQTKTNDTVDSLNEQNVRFKNELDLTKSQLNKKDVLMQSYLDRIKEQELNITKLKSKIQNVRDMKEENKQLKDYVKDLKSEHEFLREKEAKLMKVIYSIHKKGITIDDLLITTDQADTSDISSTTVYFPDKVHMEAKKQENIPLLNFNVLPDYEEPREQNQPIENKKKGLICDYNTEFIQKYDEFSESWRNGVKQMKNYKDLLKKKK